jgi:phosphatidylinositol alpha-mannosyltransferase
VKIALVSPYDLLHPGGVNAHVTQLAHALRARGLDARVLAPLAPGRPAPPDVIPLAGRLVTISSGGARARVNLDPRVIPAARALLRRHRFDVVHLHNPLSPLVGPAMLAARPAAPASAFVATFHEYRDRLNPLMELAKRLLIPLVDRLDGRIAVSRVALEFNQRRFPGRYTVIPNGVDCARFAEAAPDRDRRPTILFVGRLERRKGFAHLLHAFERLVERVPDARLVVAGSYDAAAAAPFADYAAERRLGGVEFVGPVAEAALPRLYRSADVFCAPSVDFESFGIVLLEAMASGVPIVASDIAAFRGVVEHGRQGLLVPPGDPGAIAAALASLLADPARRRAMARAGRETAAAFDWSLVSARVVDFYRDVLATRAAAR